MKFEYNEKIDKECQKMISQRDFIFGKKRITELYAVTAKSLERFEQIWNNEIDGKFSASIERIFNKKLPADFVCYINSTYYSMDIGNGISISVATQMPIRTICHEANHFMFRRSPYKNIFFPNLDVEEAKEIFTVINNIYFQDILEGPDIGWNKFWKERYNFLIIWLKNNCKVS